MLLICAMQADLSERSTMPIILEMALLNFLQSLTFVKSTHSAHEE
jgi:hypothetical protein